MRQIKRAFSYRSVNWKFTQLFIIRQKSIIFAFFRVVLKKMQFWQFVFNSRYFVRTVVLKEYSKLEAVEWKGKDYNHVRKM